MAGSIWDDLSELSLFVRKDCIFILPGQPVMDAADPGRGMTLDKAQLRQLGAVGLPLSLGNETVGPEGDTWWPSAALKTTLSRGLQDNFHVEASTAPSMAYDLSQRHP